MTAGQLACNRQPQAGAALAGTALERGEEVVLRALAAGLARYLKR